MTDMFTFEHPKNQSNIIKVIGVGGGGSNAVTHMYHEGIQGVDFILCNTDAQSLNSSPVNNKIHLGKRVLGAGNMPSVGRDAAIETKDEIRDMLQQHTKMLFITAGMGGGTGTGAAPIVAEIARELDILTVGIVTLPFSFEGKKRQQQALEGIIELRKSVDTLLLISNDKLREEYGNMKLTEAFRMADNVLTIAAKGIAEIITVTGYINVDFEDVKTVMRNSGKAIMGSARADGENRAVKAIEEAMRSPLLNDTNIKGAKNILLNITSGLEEVSLDEVHEITDYIQTECGNSAEVIWGNGTDEALGKSIGITIIATGFETDDDTHTGTVQKAVKVTPLYSNPEPVAPIAPPTAPPAVDPAPITIPDEPVAEIKQEVSTSKTGIMSLMDKLRFVDENAGKSNSDKKVQETENSPAKVHHLFEETREEINQTIEADDIAEIASEEIRIEEKVMESTEVSWQNENDKKEEIISFVIETAPLAKPETAPVHHEHFIDKEERDELDKKSSERLAKLKAMSMQLHSPDKVDELERQPAYLRRGLQLSDPDNTGKHVSRYSLDGNEDKRGLRTDNSYLHDNVD
ncbi:MAG: cell division protein FtsZ [Bacteroidales bacterium]|nr:cell division protein FtsZ [Bacteroidales bacterium]